MMEKIIPMPRQIYHTDIMKTVTFLDSPCEAKVTFLQPSGSSLDSRGFISSSHYISFFLCLFLCLSYSYADPSTKQQPNIIVVLVDDMGWSDLSCFGGKDGKTEHIDQLANEGLRFENFYVNSPICSPSRVAFSTGQYPQRWKISSYLDHRKLNHKRGLAQWLDPSAPMLARELQKNGYSTGHFGKWHMGGQRDVTDAPLPTAYGFEQSIVNFEGIGAKFLPLTMKPGDLQAGRIWQDAERLGQPVTWMQRSEITGGFVEAALSFIAKSRSAKKPFYINLWPDDVHSPFFPPLHRWGESKRALYLSVLHTMDEQLGKLFAYVRNDDELRKNTLIVFCSDNGHEPGAGSSHPLRGGKTWLYEGGIRSPLIVWCPGLMNPASIGKTNQNSMFSAIDLNRSLYALTSTALPRSHIIDGEDVSATLLGNRTASRLSPLFFRRPPDRPGNDPKWGMGDNPDLAVRHGVWKFLVNFDGSEAQLYHIQDDPCESKNLLQQYPDIAKDLQTRLFAWNHQLPKDSGISDFSESNHSKNQ